MAITVTQINLFPVKSLRGISVDASSLTTRGLRYDRRFMLVDAQDKFQTQRELPLMATIGTEIDGDVLTFISAFGDRCSVPVQPPPLPTRNVGVWSSSAEAHTVCAIADDFFSTQLGTDIRLIYMPDSAERKCSAEFAKNNEIVSFADGYPVLVASESSLADLNARIVANGGAAVPMSRFRANLVVTGADAFAEDGWIEFNIGEARLRTAKPCPRCQVTTTDQASGEIRGPEPLLTLATYRDSPGGLRFGSNLMPVALGKIRVGDTLSLN